MNHSENPETGTNGRDDRRRAYRLRQKVENNKPLKEEDKVWLNSYETRVGSRQALQKSPKDAPKSSSLSSPSAQTEMQTEQASTIDSPPPGESSPVSQETPVPTSSPIAPPVPVIPVQPQSVRVPAPPPPPPPRTSAGPEEASGSQPAGKDWRAKYKSEGFGGRQWLCEELAGSWHMILKAMEAQLVAVGVKPIIGADMLRGAMVLTLDQVLPPGLNLSPPQVALIGTTTLTAQRFLHRKEIAAAMAATVAASVPREVPVAPLPTPPPVTPAPEPAPADAVPAAVAAAVAEAVVDQYVSAELIVI